MAFTNRKTVRQRLATLLTNTGQYQAVYSYPEKNLRHQSPVCVLISNGTNREIVTDDYETNDFYITVVHLVKRNDAETTHNQLDDLELNLINTIKTNYADVDWTLAEYNDRSQVQEVVIDQEPYEMEAFTIRILTI